MGGWSVSRFFQLEFAETRREGMFQGLRIQKTTPGKIDTKGGPRDLSWHGGVPKFRIFELCLLRAGCEVYMSARGWQELLGAVGSLLVHGKKDQAPDTAS